MPFPAGTVFADGTAMDFAALQANLDGYRGYVNNVPAADWGNAAIQREHLVKPVITGDSIESSFQGVWWRTYGLEEAAALQQSEWGSRLRRLTWYPAILGAGERWRFPVGATLYLPTPSWVEVHVGAEAQSRQAAAVVTPNGAGLAGSVLGGYLTLRCRYRPLRTEFDFGYRALYPISNALAYNSDGAVKLGFCQNFTDGHWDIALEYVKTGDAFDIYQFSLGRVTMKIEAH